MSDQAWEECIFWSTIDGTSFASTASETIIFPNVTFPGGSMQRERAIKITAYGRYSNVVTAVPTLTFFVRWAGIAGTILCQSPAITLSPTAITSAPWMLEALLQTRANGSSGSVFAMGNVTLTTGVAPKMNTTTGETSAADLGLVALLSSTGTTVPAAATVDLTVDAALSLSAKFSASSPSNALQGHLLTIESLN